MIIENNRFTLREFNISDFKDVHEYASDIENLKYILWGPNTEEESQYFIENVIKMRNKIPRLNYGLAIEINTEQGKKVIGGCGIFLTDNILVGEVGWNINKEYWNMGYGTEVGKTLLDFGFNNLRLNKIFATCDSRNVGSYRIMEKCNMKKESYRPKVRSLREKGEFADEFKYSILKEEYLKVI